jgi:UDP-glucuronate decarboxylase
MDLSLGGTELDVMASETGVECIVHLANPRVSASNAALGESLTQLRNVLDVCLAYDIRLVYLSGWEIYSGYAGMLLADEATPALPRGPYGETKYLAETLIEHNRRSGGLRCAMLRSSPVYGVGADRPKFIHNFVEKARSGHRIVTHRYRNGDPALDLLHVDDLVDAVLRVLDHGFVGTLNLGTGSVTSTRQIAKMICDRLNSSSTIESTDIDADVASIAMNAGRAAAALGWRPRIAVPAGLNGLLDSLVSLGEGNGG